MFAVIGFELFVEPNTNGAEGAEAVEFVPASNLEVAEKEKAGVDATVEAVVTVEVIEDEEIAEPKLKAGAEPVDKLADVVAGLEKLKEKFGFVVATLEAVVLLFVLFSKDEVVVVVAGAKGVEENPPDPNLKMLSLLVVAAVAAEELALKEDVPKIEAEETAGVLSVEPKLKALAVVGFESIKAPGRGDSQAAHLLSLSLLLMSQTLHFHELAGGANLLDKLKGVVVDNKLEVGKEGVSDLEDKLFADVSLLPKMLFETVADFSVELSFGFEDPPNLISLPNLLPKVKPEVAAEDVFAELEPKVKAGLSIFGDSFEADSEVKFDVGNLN